MIRTEDTYNVISESSLVALIGLTNLAMASGWEPVGGVHTMKTRDICGISKQ